MKCVLCEKEAVTTAAQIPVCEEHYQDYAKEGKQYLTNRPFYNRLLQANAAQPQNQGDWATGPVETTSA